MKLGVEEAALAGVTVNDRVALWVAVASMLALDDIIGGESEEHAPWIDRLARRVKENRHKCTSVLSGIRSRHAKKAPPAVSPRR